MLLTLSSDADRLLKAGYPQLTHGKQSVSSQNLVEEAPNCRQNIMEVLKSQVDQSALQWNPPVQGTRSVRYKFVIISTNKWKFFFTNSDPLS